MQPDSHRKIINQRTNSFTAACKKGGGFVYSCLQDTEDGSFALLSIEICDKITVYQIGYFKIISFLQED